MVTLARALATQSRIWARMARQIKCPVRGIFVCAAWVTEIPPVSGDHSPEFAGAPNNFPWTTRP